MKINKLRFLSIAICCFVASLSEAQCAQKVEKNDEHLKNNQTELSAGSIVSFAGEIAPSGWLLCHGQQCSSQEYPELYEVIQTKYTPDGSWTIEANKHSRGEKFFHIPDLRGRVIVGPDGSAGRVTANNTLGANGGEEKHQLTINELAEHSHVHNYGTNNGGNSVGYSLLSAPVTSTNSEPGKSTGDNQPHNNMQPYLVLNYIIATGKANERQEQGCAKAWVTFNGSAQILESYGVSSVTTTGPGRYTIKFSRPFKTEFYCNAVSARAKDRTIFATSDWEGPETQKKESFNLLTLIMPITNSINDLVVPTYVSACFYGNQ